MSEPRRLTPNQMEAVNLTARQCLVIAPAGSGKTEVLIRRIERLLNESRGESFRLLAVTFTVKAADELKARVARSIGEEAWRVDADTIHGFALGWLQRAGRAVGISPNVVVYAHDGDRADLLRRFLNSIEEPSDVDEGTLLKILARIDFLRTSLVKPADAPNELIGKLSFRLPELFEAYVTALDDAGGIDFPGMLTKLLDLLDLDPTVPRRMKRTYRQVLVDEGQDLTEAQASLLQAIVGDSLELFVVADDRQSINGWAGGGMDWARKLVGSQSVQLELKHNFRCATQILTLAQSVARHFNPPRTDAATPPGTPDGALRACVAGDSVEEARMVADWIDRLVEEGIDPSVLVSGEWNRLVAEDIAVIARTRYGLDEVQRELEARNHRVSVQADAGSFLSSPEARLFHALLEVGVNNLNRPAWRRIDDELFNILGDCLGIVHGCESLSALRGWTASTSAYPVVNLISRSKFDPDGLDELAKAVRTGDYFTDRDLDQWDAWWSAYRASTAHQDRSGTGLLQFLLRVQQTRSDQPGIRLLTTHRSKGLEFRAVAVVDLMQGSFPHYRSLGSQEELESERRAFYVSVTRASRALLLTWPRQRNTRYGMRQADPSQFLHEAGVNVVNRF